jgi:mersacidin/lichenicidin family type 2 lantibiotic
MTHDQVIRAWKNPSFRAGLSAAEQKALPANPAGVVDLNERELTEVSGGTTVVCLPSIIVTIPIIVDNP